MPKLNELKIKELWPSSPQQVVHVQVALIACLRLSCTHYMNPGGISTQFYLELTRVAGETKEADSTGKMCTYSEVQ